MIPKTIHYCWLSDNEIPNDMARSMNTWREKLPDYEFMLWNQNSFDISQSVWVKQAFEAKKYAFAADYIRLYAVYHFGGIYLDMDVEVLKSFNDLLNYEILLAYENNVTQYFECGCFGAVPYSPYINTMLEYYEGRTFIKNDGSYDMLPMPRIMKQRLFTILQEQRITIYSEDYFTAKNIKTGIIQQTSNTYCIHHFSGSWLDTTEQYLLDRRIKIIGSMGNNFISTIIIRILNVLTRVKGKGIIKTLRYYRNLNKCR
jgi:mannosyltransferase OCH1-like enzyme